MEQQPMHSTLDHVKERVAAETIRQTKQNKNKKLSFLFILFIASLSLLQ